MDVNTNYLVSARVSHTAAQNWLDVKVTFPKQLYHSPQSEGIVTPLRPIEGYKQFPPMEFTATYTEGNPREFFNAIRTIWTNLTQRLDSLEYTGKMLRIEQLDRIIRAAINEFGFPVGVMSNGNICRLTNYEGHEDPYDYLAHYMEGVV